MNSLSALSGFHHSPAVHLSEEHADLEGHSPERAHRMGFHHTLPMQYAVNAAEGEGVEHLHIVLVREEEARSIQRLTSGSCYSSTLKDFVELACEPLVAEILTL